MWRIFTAIFNARWSIDKTRCSVSLLLSLSTCCGGDSFDCASHVEWFRWFTVCTDRGCQRFMRRDHETIKIICVDVRLLLNDSASSSLKLRNGRPSVRLIGKAWIRLISWFHWFRGKVYHHFWVHRFTSCTLLYFSIAWRNGFISTRTWTHT